MPVKKTNSKKPKRKKSVSKKTTAKKSTKKKPARKKAVKKKKTPSKKVKKDIAEAVENIPELVASQVDLPKPPVAPVPPKPEPLKPYTNPKNSGFLLWTGVIIVSVVIFVLWIINTQSVILDITQGDSAEQELWDATTSDIESILADVSKEHELETLKNTLTDEDETTSETEEEIAKTLTQLLSTSPTTTREGSTK